MKWRGETKEQWAERVGEWHRHFCLIPTQMRNGNWVWLEYCWAIRVWSGAIHWWQFSDSVCRPESLGPTTAPPPKPKG